jgi:hypothetical protein
MLTWIDSIPGNITNHERMLATLAGEIVDYVPAWPQGFPNMATMRRQQPAHLLADDMPRFPQQGAHGSPRILKMNWTVWLPSTTTLTRWPSG